MPSTFAPELFEQRARAPHQILGRPSRPHDEHDAVGLDAEDAGVGDREQRRRVEDDDLVIGDAALRNVVQSFGVEQAPPGSAAPARRVPRTGWESRFLNPGPAGTSPAR